ncbi:serine/threonine-protein kinase [Nocardioides plantarum]|uniref:Serine/threonine-protein kinase n=1 Tax=Nocardioides plantarum TaxID=29299 RepID=A0ABV5KFE8_9ACTN|nr:serine/threonine-protein kinase [Nocardioides plantarum]
MPYADPPLAGRYHLLEELGAGATGTVHRAWDLREQRFVAVKLLRAHARAPDPGDHRPSARLGCFVREQSVRITHPHVAAPTGWIADDDRVALTMDLFGGGSLADLVAARRGEPFGASYVAVLLGQLLDALAAVHAAGVVHRDVKPANLLLESTGHGRPHLRLGDFGVAAVVGRPHDDGPLGTPGFAAPEQLAGAAPDPRQDLYAAGVTARRLLGRAPGPLDELVADLVQPDPDRRPASAREARHRLDMLGVVRPLRWPRVPDRCGPGVVPVPAAVRRPGHARPVAPAWLLTTGFLASAATTSTTVWLLAGR